MKKNPLYYVVIPFLLALASCDDKSDDPKKNEENELITKVKLHLVKVGDSNKMVHAEWKDETPDDNNNRTVDTLQLDTNCVYTGEIELEDDTKSPSIDISDEIAKEKDDHLFIYRQDPLESSIRFTVERTDRDSKNLPVGLKFKFTTKNLSGNSRLQVILKHQPGIKDGSEAPGDTDMDVWFPVKIK